MSALDDYQRRRRRYWPFSKGLLWTHKENKTIANLQSSFYYYYYNIRDILLSVWIDCAFFFSLCRCIDWDQNITRVVIFIYSLLETRVQSFLLLWFSSRLCAIVCYPRRWYRYSYLVNHVQSPHIEYTCWIGVRARLHPYMSPTYKCIYRITIVKSAAFKIRALNSGEHIKKPMIWTIFPRLLVSLFTHLVGLLLLPVQLQPSFICFLLPFFRTPFVVRFLLFSLLLFLDYLARLQAHDRPIQPTFLP